MSVTTGTPPTTAGTLWRLARPAGMPLVLALPLVGYGFGHWEWGLDMRSPRELPWLLLSWWLLSAGTLWLNAALDQDDGEVLMGPTVAVPSDIHRWGYAALLACVLVSIGAGWGPALCAAVCAVLAVAYSHPRLAWKGHSVLGPLVNVVGYGLLSPLAGWLLVETSATRRTLPAALVLACWVAGTTFGAQAFQQREDARRGYRTLVVTHGPPVAIAMARLGYGLAVWGMVGLAVVGWFPRALVLAVLPWLWLDHHLSRWQHAPDPERASWARQMLRRAVVVAVVVLLAAAAHHVVSLAGGGRPAGLGTAWSPWP